tara:strand:+ start:480 stop:1715 length:1236 start_codon:yes stop_codon:yes gene_type:complete
MKIIFFLENNSNGGMDSFVANLINNWPDQKDKFCLICNNSHPGLPNLKSSINVECEFIDHEIATASSVTEYFLGFFPAQIKRLFRPLIKILLYPYQFKKISFLFSSIGGDRLMSINGAYPGGETCRIANIAWNKLGRGLSVHNIHNFAIPPRLFVGWYENWIDLKLEKSVSSFVGVSKCCASSLKKRPRLINSSKIKFIYNGVTKPDVNIIKTDLRESLNIKNSPMCLMLANYESRKGHAFLFESFKLVNQKFPNAHLVICGDSVPSAKHDVQKKLSKIAPHSNVHLLDFIPGGSSLISQADVLLVASQEMESFGLTVAESMIRGVPVVSTNVGGLAEVVGKNGEAGFSIKPDDVSQFANAIISLFEDSKLRSSIIEKGLQRVNKKFTIERMAEEYKEIICKNKISIDNNR